MNAQRVRPELLKDTDTVIVYSYDSAFLFRKGNKYDYERYLPTGGYWIIHDSTAVQAGLYRNEDRVGVWKTFNLKNELVRETEVVTVLGKEYLTHDAVFVKGVKQSEIKMNWFLKISAHLPVYIFMILGILFLVRIIINGKIYNKINETNLNVFYFTPFSKNFTHSLISVYTLWWFKFRDETKELQKDHNYIVLSIILLSIYVIVVLKSLEDYAL